jgi:hypothetical protein
MVAPPGTGSLTTTQVMSALRVDLEVHAQTSPRDHWPLSFCSTGATLR